MILYFLSHVGIPRDVFIQNMRKLRAAGPSWNGCSIAVCGKAGGWSERTVTLLYILIKFYGKFICPFFFFMILLETTDHCIMQYSYLSISAVRPEDFQWIKSK